MPQLPSVSELLIGAHNPPAGPEVRPDTHLPQTFSTSTSSPKKSSETSPRQAEVYVQHPPVAPMHSAGPPAKVSRVSSGSFHAYPGMVHTGLSEAQNHQVQMQMQMQTHNHNHNHNLNHIHSHSHIPEHPKSAPKEMFAVPSTTSSGRNSISSVGSDPHGPTYMGSVPPFSASQMDYFNYRESQRARHMSSQSSSHSQSSSPQLQYRQRHGSSAGLTTRATSYHSLGSSESVTRVRSRSPPGDSPTYRPRPASFSFAPGPVPLGAPGVYNPHMTQQYNLPGPGPVPPQAQAPPGAPLGAPAHFAFYNGPTAGSGYAPNFHQSGMPGHALGTVPGSLSGQGNMPYNPQLSPRTVGGPPPSGSYFHMEGMAPVQNPQGRQTHHHGSVSSDEYAMLAADPNHALINKRCIIKRRTRTGCLTCRKRRIKCDERKPHCFNCERSKKLCLGYEAPSGNNNNSNNSSRSGSIIKPESCHAEQPAVERHRSSVHDLM
ncbi:hypothetical protein JCM33374_g4161 [Metschnikowia sp. JCM 33374]|nr:hypothetical protein JCM33374_g4161 [Metschnikowia sp. JCM 33374]